MMSRCGIYAPMLQDLSDRSILCAQHRFEPIIFRLCRGFVVPRMHIWLVYNPQIFLSHCELIFLALWYMYCRFLVYSATPTLLNESV